MKTVLITLLFIPAFLNAFAQDSSCIKKEYDQFEGTTNYRITDTVFRINDKVSLMISAGGSKISKKNMYLYFIDKNMITTDENSTVTLLFSDGSKQKMTNTIRYNLNGTFMLVYPDIKFGGGKKMIQELLSNNIKAIRFNGFSTLDDVEISPDISSALNKILNCFYSGWKKYEND